MTNETTPTRDHPCHGFDLAELDPSPVSVPAHPPMTEQRLKAAANELGQLSTLLGNEDTIEVCSLVAQLLDTLEPKDLADLFAGFTRLATVPADDTP